jgi:hypothetical protein
VVRALRTAGRQGRTRLLGTGRPLIGRPKWDSVRIL